MSCSIPVLLLKLQFVQLFVEAASLEEGGMRPSLNNLSFMHDHNEVSPLDC